MTQFRLVFKELFLLFALVFLSIDAVKNDFSILHNVNLIFHEAGHTIFSFFGDFVSIMGGSIMQILVPLIVAMAFIKEGRMLGLIFSIWWIGDNLVDIAIYANDANLRLIPLLGGDNVIHDWWYILSSMGQLDNAHTVGFVINFFGIVIMSISIGILIKLMNDRLQSVQK